MSMQTRAAMQETARDFLVVSAFGFLATVLGFVDWQFKISARA